MTKSEKAFRTISEVSKELDVPAHVLRFWETKFPQVKPMKRGGGRRYYRPEDVSLLRGVREMLHVDGFSIKGVQKAMKEQGVKAIAERSDGVPVNTLAQQEVPIHAATAAADRADGSVPMTTADRKALRKALEALLTLRESLLENGRKAA